MLTNLPEFLLVSESSVMSAISPSAISLAFSFSISVVIYQAYMAGMKAKGYEFLTIDILTKLVAHESPVTFPFFMAIILSHSIAPF